jgi:quercetin dioxygenase-like cupin family protein
MATIASSRLQVKRGNAPDESRPFESHGHADLHKIGKSSVMRAFFEPGWRWSKHLAPIMGTKLCQSPHLGYVVSGRMRIQMEDGTEAEMAPGDFFKIAPGHDAWVVGDERCVLVDFAGNEHYAQAPGPHPAERGHVGPDSTSRRG